MSKNKPIPQPITKADLEAFIEKQDDFALELSAYRLALGLGFAATHAGTYTDSVTGKARQFDVRASRSCGQNFHVYLAIECKAVQDYSPVLISQIPRAAVESYQTVAQSAGRVKGFSAPVLEPGGIRRVEGTHSLYPIGDYVGKSLAQVSKNGTDEFKSNDGDVYEKWGQAVASANGLIRKALGLNKNLGMPSQGAIILPVLVVPNERLWTVNYDETGTRQGGPIQVDEVRMYIGVEQTLTGTFAFTYTISHLHIVTESGLEGLLRRFADGGSDVQTLLDFVF